jgi:hypothetical protein
MSTFGKRENEKLHRLCETSNVGPAEGRLFAGFVSRHIERQKQTIADKDALIAQAVAFLTGGVCACTCVKCSGVVSAERVKAYKCPRVILLKNLGAING